MPKKPFSNIIFSTLIFCILSCFAWESSAQKPTLQITVDSTAYMPGDTMLFTCMVPEWINGKKIGTLNVWIEDVNKTMIWKLRYPVLAGVCEAQIVIPKSLPADYYALYFQLQNDFFGLTGKTAYRIRNDSLNYTLLLETKDLLAGKVALDEDGSFKLPKHVFPGTATVFFSESRKRRNNSDLDIDIVTPLDSTFIPIADTLIIIKAGTIKDTSAAEDYTLQKETFLGGNRGTLDNVEIVAQRKSPIDKFNEEVSRGLFSSGESEIFDGLDGQFLGFTNIFAYLQGRVSGLQVQQSEGEFTLQWRGEATALFLDEIPVDAETISSIPPNDIAMIKVFSPPFMGAFNGGAGGAIAIYTKRGGGVVVSRFKNRFLLNGYTPLEFVLTPPYKSEDQQ